MVADATHIASCAAEVYERLKISHDDVYGAARQAVALAHRAEKPRVAEVLEAVSLLALADMSPEAAAHALIHEAAKHCIEPSR